MLKRKIFALMSLVAVTVSSVNAKNYEGEKEDMRIVVNNTDFSVNTDLTSYFDGQTPTPIEHNENYDSYYVTPVAGKTMSYPLEFQFDARNHCGKAFVFKEHCYIMKIDSNYIEPPYFITRYSFPGNLFIDCVAIEDATGVYNQSAKPEGDEFVTVYDATGHVIRSNVEKTSSLDGLKSGIYIVNGKKVMVNNK